jgi:hypothetical protein
MAKTIKQIVVQDNLDNVPKRFIVQYYDDVAEQDGQEIVFYSDLTAEEQATYDNLITLGNSKI